MPRYWITDEGGGGHWEEVDQPYQPVVSQEKRIDGNWETHISTALGDRLALTDVEEREVVHTVYYPSERYENYMNTPTDEKPWFDRILPGDQDSIGDLVPDFLEPDEGDDFLGALIDPFLPGDQDTIGDVSFLDEGVEALGAGADALGDLQKLIPLMFMMSLFDGGRRR